MEEQTVNEETRENDKIWINAREIEISLSRLYEAVHDLPLIDKGDFIFSETDKSEWLTILAFPTEVESSWTHVFVNILLKIKCALISAWIAGFLDSEIAAKQTHECATLNVREFISQLDLMLETVGDTWLVCWGTDRATLENLWHQEFVAGLPLLPHLARERFKTEWESRKLRRLSNRLSAEFNSISKKINKSRQRGQAATN